MKGLVIRIGSVVLLILFLASCSNTSPAGTLKPALSVPSPSRLSLFASINTSSSATFSFKNNFDTATTYTATESASWLTITSGASGSLAVNQSATVTVRGTCGATPGQSSAIVTLTTPNDVETVKVSLYCSAYNIQLIFNAGISASRQAVFRAAATRWSRLVIGDVANVPLNKAANACGAGEPAFNATLDDLVIYASVEPIDGVGNILGSAGPCFIRTTGGLTMYGVMRFDSADVATLEAAGTFDEVILHEMGHVLGIGSLWQVPGFFNLINYAPTTTTCRNTATFTTQPTFTGVSAKLEYGILGGVGNPPAENGGGAGTKCAHWDEERFDNELMTGFLGGTSSSTVNPLSRMTVGSLKDLGYQVNKNLADPYSIPACSPACLRSESVGLNIASREVVLLPVGTVNPTGAVTLFKK
jgi:Leishmanolysin/Viral BACON domain